MTKFAAVGIVAHNMEASIEFYTQLGLSVAPAEDSTMHADLIGAGVRVMLDNEELIKKLDPQWTRPSAGYAIALAFECQSPSQVDQLYAALTSGGATGKQEPWDAFWGQRYATVLDPDGNPIDLFCNLAQPD